MAECLETLCEACLLEQEEEITVLRSIFMDDLQARQSVDGKTNICFNLKVKVNIPFDVVDVEAFIPVDFEDPRRHFDSSSSVSSGEFKDSSTGVKVDGASFQSHPEDPPTVPATTSASEADSLDHSRVNSNTEASVIRAKPAFSRSLSLQHWYVRANIRYLTPIYLTCQFPPLYPTKSPPEFSLACLWLTKHQLQKLGEKLMQLWTETPNLPIVFTWVDWLQNYTWEYLQLHSRLVLKESCELMLWPNADENSANSQGREESDFDTQLAAALLNIFEHDLEMQRQVFQQGIHECEICFDERYGSEFHYFDECGHFFCHECLRAHCELHVGSGTVLSLLCPSHDCKSTIPVQMLKMVLDKEKLDRWEHLLLNKTLDIMGDICYCPSCNVAVVVDEDRNLKLGHCANCFFAFCTECYEPWHPGQPCLTDESDSNDEELTKRPRHKKSMKGKNGKEERDDKTEQKKKEKQHKIVLSNLSFIRKMQEQGVYQYCPKCHMAVERIAGCDMMHCTQCRANFCWTCGMRNLKHSLKIMHN